MKCRIFRGYGRRSRSTRAAISLMDPKLPAIHPPPSDIRSKLTVPRAKLLRDPLVVFPHYSKQPRYADENYKPTRWALTRSLTRSLVVRLGNRYREKDAAGYLGAFLRLPLRCTGNNLHDTKTSISLFQSDEFINRLHSRPFSIGA